MTVPFYTERDSYNSLPFGLIFGEYAPRRETFYKEVKKGRASPCKCGEAAFVFPLRAKGKFSPLRGENQGLARPT